MLYHQKELNALIYYTSKLAGWYGDDLFSNSCEFFRKNLVWGQEKKPWRSPPGEELCSHSDSHLDSDSDPMLPIIYNITNGWKAVTVCSQGNETQNNLCKTNYFKKLPNFAYHKVDKTLYKSIKFLGKGAENKVYKVELNHTYYNTTHIALRAFVKSMHGLRKNDIPPYLATRALIKASSTDSLNIDDFFPKIFSVYFSSLPDDVKNIKLYEGTDINASLIPTGLYDNHFFRGAETGFLPEGVDVRYIPVDQKHMGWEMPILPALYTEMELVDGGSLASLSKIPDEVIAETYFMEYALSIKNFHNSDHRLENVGLKTVPYLRAYHKDDKIYLMTSESMPQILDWDWVANRKDKTQSHLFQHVSEKDIKKQVSGMAMEFMRSITWNGLFSSKTQKFLKQYLVTEKDIKNQKLKGSKIKHYVIT